MLIGIRYHLSTLITMFLVLTLGILIGSLLAGDDTLIEEQKNMINRLEDDFNTLRNHNYKLKENINNLQGSLKQYQNAQKELLQMFLKDRLVGENLVLKGISRESYPEFFNIMDYSGANLQVISDFEDEEIKEEFSFTAGLILSVMPEAKKISWKDEQVLLPAEILNDPVEIARFILQLEQMGEEK